MKHLRIAKFITNEPNAPFVAKEEMANWRERIFNKIFISLMVISAVVYIPPLIAALEAGLWWVGVNYFVSLLVLFLLVFLKNFLLKLEPDLVFYFYWVLVGAPCT